jgi:hypothetical protein
MHRPTEEVSTYRRIAKIPKYGASYDRRPGWISGRGRRLTPPGWRVRLLKRYLIWSEVSLRFIGRVLYRIPTSKIAYGKVSYPTITKLLNMFKLMCP